MQLIQLYERIKIKLTGFTGLLQLLPLSLDNSSKTNYFCKIKVLIMSSIKHKLIDKNLLQTFPFEFFQNLETQVLGRLLVLLILFCSPLLGLSQTVCTINSNVNWSACTCVETGLAPVNGNKIVIAAGKTLTINVSTAPFFVGDIDVNGTLISGQNGAQLNGSIHVFSGGTFDLNKKLNLGSSAGCGYTVVVDNGGSITTSGGGASSLLSICGVAILADGGGCGSYAAGCTPPAGWPTTGISFDQTGIAGVNYIWKGTTSDWTVSTNWTPARNTITVDDFLTFDASGTIKSVTNIPSESVGKIVVTGNSTYSFVSSGSKTITLNTAAIGNAFQIDNGSILSNGSAGNPINFTMPSGGTASIGGQLNLVNGNFDASNATLTLHTNSSPLARTSGQVSLNGNSSLRFGDASNTTGSTIVVPNNIFVSAPIITSLILNRTNGATLGDQSITVTSAATFTLGDLITNGSGRIKFGTAASSPVETGSSKIIGYAEMNPRTIGTGAIDFLGLSMTAGADDIGFFSVVRRTGISGRNIFNGNESIDVSWDTNSGINPAGGRNVVFRWLPAFDNITTSTNNFQSYIFNSGPGWTPLGTLQPLTATSPLRQSTAVSTIKLDDTFTLTDQTQILPVKLISFKADAFASYIKLDWVTATEVNFDYFHVERASENLIFKTLDRITAKGGVGIETAYTLLDYNPLEGKNYYRLRMVDVDGSFEYSDVVFIAWGNKSEGVVLYPNPVINHEFKVKIDQDYFTDTFIIVINNLGVEVHSQKIQYNEEAILMDQDIKPGIYFVKVLGSTLQGTFKLIVQ